MSAPRERLRIGIQKSGRLADRSLALLSKAGVNFDLRKDRLLHASPDFPIDLMLVRDDDIPAYVNDGVCDLGIVGENAVQEAIWAAPVRHGHGVTKLQGLGFGACRLVIAVPERLPFDGLASLRGARVATSYPNCLNRLSTEEGLELDCIQLAGSVEIAPGLGIADAVCDLVSTGGTLRSNGLREVFTLFETEAVLLRTERALPAEMERDLARLAMRLKGVTRAANAKYVMMNAPRSALERIQQVIPGMEAPTVIPLSGDGDRVAIHAVAYEEIFWETLETLQACGASSILVLPIEKVIA